MHLEKITEQAQKFGFSHKKFLNCMSSISKEFLLTQTLEYWLLTYMSETATDSTDSWNEDYSPDAWLIECFSLKTANFIVTRVSEEYLKAQTPKYWIDWAIYQFTNQASKEFISFIENASENKVHVFKNIPIIVKSIGDTSDKGNELNLLLETDLNQFNNNKSTWYYHTTDLISAESIFTDGISLVAGQKKQDFGGRTSSFYLNDEFKWAIDFRLQKFISSPSAIIIYDIPETLLKEKEYKHLDLNNGNKRWKDVVHKSCNYCACETDEYGSVYGPQTTNYVRMIKNKYETPKVACLNLFKILRLVSSKFYYRFIIVSAEFRQFRHL
ncbi:hypothetical protein RirG_151220 [Rhizophagus irregularis DAOM 197198w]|uniref:Uncharacterized protein n=1 Tax=Rhizophagus irregularis (strain DAOM 197198w) TaxID=1432141 RepID=A0A015J248_RHIIW|nr:hypothetical protein RirG_151220 [Rhizophagus irregularis DAOM 197198w]